MTEKLSTDVLITKKRSKFSLCKSSGVYWKNRAHRLRKNIKRYILSYQQPKRISAVSDGFDIISYLPDEVMLNIFSWLSPAVLTNHAPLVCRRWHELALHPELWKTLIVTNITANTVKICDRLRISPKLKVLTLTARDDADVILREVCRSNLQLESLRLCRCRGSAGRLEVSGDLMARVLRSCPAISTLITEDNTEIHSKAFYRTLAERSLKGSLQHLRVENATVKDYIVFLRTWTRLSKNSAMLSQVLFWVNQQRHANRRYHIEIRNRRFITLF